MRGTILLHEVADTLQYAATVVTNRLLLRVILHEAATCAHRKG